LENPSRKLKLHHDKTTTIITLRDDQYTVLIISRSVFLGRTNSDIITEKLKVHNPCSVTLYQKFTSFMR